MSKTESVKISSPLYIVQENETLGRYLVATRDIAEGEILISEGPILSAPSDSWENEKIQIYRCLNCCLDLVDEIEFNRCSKCFFPCCSKECEENPQHAENECKVFCFNKVIFPPPFVYQVLNKSIMVLRAHVKKRSNTTNTWNNIMTMESHFESRRDKPSCCDIDKRIIANIHVFFQNEEILPDDEEIRKLSGIIDSNAHLLPQRLNGKSTDAGVCHIFHQTSLLSHSCVPNAAWAVSPESESTLVTRASVRIPKGHEICVTYDVGEIMYGTLRRLIPLEITGLFICRCPRCLDPTELGTNLSTLICQKCQIGHVLPLQPTDSFSDWSCHLCFNTQTDEEILDLIEKLEYEIGFPKYNVLFSTKEESIEDLEYFRNKYSGKRLHPSHYILQEVKLRWVKQTAQQILSRMTGSEILNLYVPSCEELLALLSVISPGVSEYRAIVQFHLCQGIHRLMELNPSLMENGLDQLKTLGPMALAYFKNNYGFPTFVSKMEKLLEVTNHNIN